MFLKTAKRQTTKPTPTTGIGDDNIFFEYYVVFEDSDNIGYPWRWFTCKGFRHVSVYMAFEGIVMNVNQSLYNIRIYSHYLNIHQAGEILAENPKATVVYVPVIANKKYRNKLGTIIPTCVSLCQRITGLTSHAFTPYGYYKHLVRSGGQVMGGKPKQDTGLIEAQRKQLAETQKREAEAKAAADDLSKRRRLGRKSLLGTEGDELGVL